MEPFRLDPDTFYHDGDVRLKLGVTSHALSQARRGGKLKFARKGRALLYRGDWIVEWLSQAEVNHQEEAAHE